MNSVNMIYSVTSPQKPGWKLQLSGLDMSPKSAALEAAMRLRRKGNTSFESMTYEVSGDVPSGTPKVFRVTRKAAYAMVEVE
jgi:hypothetical protein